MSRRERGYVLALVVLLALLLIKSFVLDPVRLEDPGEMVFATWVDERLAQTYTGVLYDGHIFVHRLVAVDVREEEGETLYVGKVRRYLIGVLPLSEQHIKEKVSYFN